MRAAEDGQETSTSFGRDTVAPSATIGQSNVVELGSCAEKVHGSRRLCYDGVMDFPIVGLLDDELSTAWVLKYFHPRGLRCPHCQAHVERAGVFREGKRNKLCVYRCERCQGVYTAYSGTVFAGLYPGWTLSISRSEIFDFRLISCKPNGINGYNRRVSDLQKSHSASANSLFFGVFRLREWIKSSLGRVKE